MKIDIESLLEVAQLLSARNGGMASVSLEWHPYKSVWESKADWSNGHKIKATGETAKKSCNNLFKRLISEL